MTVRRKLAGQVANLLSVPEQLLTDQLLTDVLIRPGCRIERIVSFGQVTPADRPFEQEWDEWVLILQGPARIMMNAQEFALAPGEHLLIPAHVAHWVTFTAPDSPTVWLTIHFR